jgi:hypothetical protein
MPLKFEGELRCSGRVYISCSTSGTRRVNLVTNPVITHEWGQDREVFTTRGTYLWSFVFSGVGITRYLDLCVPGTFCISLYVLLYFFSLPLCCLFFSDIQILITHLVFSSSSHYSPVCNQLICISNIWFKVERDSVKSIDIIF